MPLTVAVTCSRTSAPARAALGAIVSLSGSLLSTSFGSLCDCLSRCTLGWSSTLGGASLVLAKRVDEGMMRGAGVCWSTSCRVRHMVY